MVIQQIHLYGANDLIKLVHFHKKRIEYVIATLLSLHQDNVFLFEIADDPSNSGRLLSPRQMRRLDKSFRWLRFNYQLKCTTKGNGIEA